MIIRDILTEITADSFAACGYDRTLGHVTESNRPDLCQFQCNGALAAAKQYKKAPLLIANEIATRLREDKRLATVTAIAPGFINMNLTDEYLAEIMNKMTADKRLLLPLMQSTEKRTIVVDFGGPNIAKPLHVGHLRSAIIGDSLCRLARFLGHMVIGDVHLGDWGLQMGLVLAEIENRLPALDYFDKSYDGEYPEKTPINIDELNEIYPAASLRAKSDAVFAAKAAQATVELQDGRRGYRALWRKICDLSIADLKKSYDILGVSFDTWYGESDSDRYIPQVISILKEKGLLRQSEGAQIVDVELPEDREPMPPIIIVKSNGGDVYGTTDLGTILQRVGDWQPDEIWYVVDNRQALHFKQVFRCAEKSGISAGAVCRHIGFGTMNGADGKPYKTRDGGVMRLSDMISTVTQNAYDKVCQSEIVMDGDQQKAAAQKIGVAALKIGDLINHRTKDYVFDMERFLSSDGKTGPYLQYTSVRINSVLSRAKEEGLQTGAILAPASDTERELMLSLTSVADVLLRACEEKAPNAICEVLFTITGLFNRFYAENKILVCPDNARRASWLTLLSLTCAMINTLLEILGISVPEKM